MAGLEVLEAAAVSVALVVALKGVVTLAPQAMAAVVAVERQQVCRVRADPEVLLVLLVPIEGVRKIVDHRKPTRVGPVNPAPRLSCP